MPAILVPSIDGEYYEHPVYGDLTRPHPWPDFAHPHGWDPWCVPFALSAITGYSTDAIRILALHREHLTTDMPEWEGMDGEDIMRVLRLLRIHSQWVPSTEDEPTLDKWADGHTGLSICIVKSDQGSHAAAVRDEFLMDNGYLTYRSPTALHQDDQTERSRAWRVLDSAIQVSPAPRHVLAS